MRKPRKAFGNTSMAKETVSFAWRNHKKTEAGGKLPENGGAAIALMGE